jgi:hypothetical protein
MSEQRVDEWLALIREFLRILAARKKRQFNRRASIGDLLSERRDNAAAYGFGEGTTMYDNVFDTRRPLKTYHKPRNARPAGLILIKGPRFTIIKLACYGLPLSGRLQAGSRGSIQREYYLA